MSVITEKVIDPSLFELTGTLSTRSDGSPCNAHAIDKRTGKKVVLRFLRQGDGQRVASLLEFLDTKAPMFRAVYGVGQLTINNQPHAFIAVEDCPNIAPLGIDKPTPEWNATRKSKYVFGVAAGMCLLHSRNIIHYGIGPGTVRLDENWEPKLCGLFGTEFEAKMKHLLCPFSLAPEVLRLEGFSKKVDVYSYGFMLYSFFASFLTAFNQFEKPAIDMSWDVEAFLKCIRNILSVRPSGVPDFYWQLITQCLETDPDRRPSFREIVSMLHEHTDQYILPGADIEAVKDYESRMLPFISD